MQALEIMLACLHIPKPELNSAGKLLDPELSNIGSLVIYVSGLPFAKRQQNAAALAHVDVLFRSRLQFLYGNRCPASFLGSVSQNTVLEGINSSLKRDLPPSVSQRLLHLQALFAEAQ